MEEVSVKLEGFPGKELTVRTGAALPLKEPKVVRIEGDIRSVGAFISGRNDGWSTQAIDRSKAVIFTDYKNLTMELLLDPESPYGASVKGSLELSDELKAFCINENKTWSREQFVKLLRFSKMHFADADQHEKVLLAYQAFTAEVAAEIKESKDNRGNKSNAFAKNVKSNVPEDFVLHIPIFKGEKLKKFRVEIGLDVSEGSVKFWLESVELHEMIEKEKKEIFQQELKQALGFVIVNK